MTEKRQRRGTDLTDLVGLRRELEGDPQAPIYCTLGEITLSFATCGTVHHWPAGPEVGLET